MDHKYTRTDEVRDVSAGKRHVVILGAGASRAAFPDGDKYGRKLPLMADIFDILNISGILEKHGAAYTNHGNFEELYAKLYKEDNKPVMLDIENAIEMYFSKLTLPDTPTLYDHMVLSLRPKDVIATFNWDPFLFKACQRNYYKASLPHIVFLHGNVAIGYCLNDKKKGPRGTICSLCGKDCQVPPLLYPITKKNYNDNPFISAEWTSLQMRLKDAYFLTIFGYSAPHTDIEAFSLLQQAWGRPESRALEQVELIDIRSKDELRKSWDAFIHIHHYEIHNSYYSSWLTKHPRRSCEAAWKQFMEVKFVEEASIPFSADFDNLWKWYEPLVEAEVSASESL